MVCMVCMVCMSCMSCMSFMSCMSCMSCMSYMSCMPCMSCISCMSCMSHMSCMSCLSCLVLSRHVMSCHVYAPQPHILEKSWDAGQAWWWPNQTQRNKMDSDTKNNFSKPVQTCHYLVESVRSLQNVYWRNRPDCTGHQTRQWKTQHGLYSATIRPLLYVKKSCVFECPDLPKIICLPSNHWLDLVLGGPNTFL